MCGDCRPCRLMMQPNITDHLAEALKAALARAGLPAPDAVQWEVPRDERHGDYATNAAMTLARAARRPPRAVAEAIVAHFPETAAVDRLEIAGPGFLNVFLRPRWCAEALARGPRRRRGLRPEPRRRGPRVPLEFVSANPTGPLVIVNARAAAVGDALARILELAGRRGGGRSTTSTTPATSSRRWPAPSRRGCARHSANPWNCPPTPTRASISPISAREWLAKEPAAMREMLALPEAERRRPPRRAGGGASGWRASGGCCEAYGTRFRSLGPRAGRRPGGGPGRAAHRDARRRRPHLRAGRRPLVPLHRVRRRQGPRAAELRRRAHVLRGGHRASTTS